MDLTIIMVIGIATFFNFAIIFYKFSKKKTLNALIDTAIFVIISLMFIGSVNALSIGMVASFLFSLYLLFMPVKFSFFTTNRTGKRRRRKGRVRLSY